VDYYDIGGALVVNQTADVIREVQDLLESLRRLQETSVAVEIRVISLSEEFFERVGVDFSVNISTLNKNRLQFERALTTGSFRPQPFINSIDGVPNGVTVGYNPAQGGFTPDLNVPVRATSFPLSLPPFGGYQVNGLNPNLDGGLGVGLAFLNDIQVYMFLEAAQGDQRVSIMQAPKVTLFNGQTSTVFVSDVAFFTISLQAYNVGGQFVYIPQNIPLPIGRSPAPPGSGGGSGVSVTVQAIVSADKRFVRLNLAPTLTALTSATVPLFPVTAFITPVFEGGSQGVPIPFTQFYQQPAISQITVQTTVAVPDGGTAVLGGLKTLAEGRNEFGPPVLSKIPYLNRLFRNQGIGRETRHIMIMVTPRIIIQSEEELNQTGPGGALLPPPGGM
jgi:type II secretory pathway component GspD/PulD (secretin)